MQQNNQRTNIKTRLGFLALAFAGPLVLFWGAGRLGGRRYLFVCLFLILYALLLFFLRFERRHPKAREIVLVAVLSALAVASRAAFFMIPQFKPMAAVVIIAGACFGAECGFLVGTLGAFASNMFFGQGPSTPWQMFGFGMVGLCAALLFHTGLFERKRVPLTFFGAFFTYFVYGTILNISHLLITNTPLTLSGLLAVFAAGFMFDLIHTAATAVFLFLIGEPLIFELERVKTKYGLLD